jgi:uncharacterized damage-inducible protein DinB
MIRTEAVLDSWKAVRADTAQAVEDFPGDDLDFKPLPELMSFREIARHVLLVGHGCAGLLLDGFGDFSSAEMRQRIREHLPECPVEVSAAELTAKLRSSLEERTPALARQDGEFWKGMVTRFDGTPVTRLEMLQYLKEHELTHRSQMFMYLRLKGVVPPTTRRKAAAK